jgi:hypothetical protein
MQWTLHQTESGEGSQNLKISSWGGIDTNLKEGMKEGTQKGQMRDKGKPSFVITAERSDTSHETVDNQNATITPPMQVHRTTDKVTLKTVTHMLQDK